MSLGVGAGSSFVCDVHLVMRRVFGPLRDVLYYSKCIEDHMDASEK